MPKHERFSPEVEKEWGRLVRESFVAHCGEGHKMRGRFLLETINHLAKKLLEENMSHGKG